jgi:hypothetical protein
MSIWSSFYTLGYEDGTAPYTDFKDATGYYTSNTPESLASTPRGGFLDVAATTMCDLIRLGIDEGDDDDRDVTVWLDPDQAEEMASALITVANQARGHVSPDAMRSHHDD